MDRPAVDPSAFAHTPGSFEPQRIMPADHWDWTIPTSFSQGWRIGPWVFVGGQVARDAAGRIVGPGDIGEQTRCVFENIGKVLTDAGAAFSDIVKLNTYYVYDGEEADAGPFWEAMTRVRMGYLPTPGPAATAVRVAGLAWPGQLIEVEALAYVRDSTGESSR
jgi:2-iminobutanoate/2-iminopropanoate deaminase